MKTKWLEKDNEKFYPVGHAEATLDKNGKTVQSSLDKIPTLDREISDAKEEINDMDNTIKELVESDVGKKTASGGEIFNNATDAGWNGHAEGEGTAASGFFAHAEGWDSLAKNYASHAEGYKTTASGSYAHAEGTNTTASGISAHAEGGATTASGNYSHAEGADTTASGNYSHAEGGTTTTSGTYAHAEGLYTTASGDYSHAEGASTIASGDYSHAGGESTKASSRHQTVIGKYNVEDTSNQYAFIIGNGTDNTHRHNLFAVGWDGKVYVNGTAIN